MKLRSRFLPVAAVAALALAACDAGDDAQDPGIEDTETETGTDDTDLDTEADADTADADTADDDATDDDATDEGAEGATADEGADGAGAVELGVASSDIGDHLVDGEGRTLYLSTNDEDGTSNCLNDCAQVWQPLLVDGQPTVSGDLDESLLGTTDRGDGTGTQVTYDGAPLYHFISDADQGDVRGQGLNGTWWAVAPEGGPVEEGGAQSEPGDADVATDEDEAEEDA
ncbi:hypothetical protein [Egicoccus sp. AB-alg6-2]|uniref:COG4315 family predicted lipoprotein n=1 Tax=Egicoccus sp. AB-alg6-2 TaxID=3242692 RepID=UPI00359DF61A